MLSQANKGFGQPNIFIWQASLCRLPQAAILPRQSLNACKRYYTKREVEQRQHAWLFHLQTASSQLENYSKFPVPLKSNDLRRDSSEREREGRRIELVVRAGEKISDKPLLEPASLAFTFSFRSPSRVSILIYTQWNRLYLPFPRPRIPPHHITLVSFAQPLPYTFNTFTRLYTALPQPSSPNPLFVKVFLVILLNRI